MSIAFVVLKLKGGQIDHSKGVTGSGNSPGGIGLMASAFSDSLMASGGVVPPPLRSQELQKV